MTITIRARTAALLPSRATGASWPWEKIGLAALLLGTAAAYLWGLDRNGWANPYYSAAAQAGSQDWKAFFYGSLDAGNLITIDKPPLSIWIMSLSVRLFGLNSWALLVPQALMGVTTTWLIYKIIRRSHPAAPALLGGLIYATTPVVVLMSRYNNPEPLMGLLTVAAAYFVLRATEDNRWIWYLLAGTSLGLGFMAKQIQAFLPIPALVLAVVLFGAGTIASRLLRLLASLAALIISGGWWMAIVELTPAANRPYIGGSATNSILELTLDYNGLARFMGSDSGPDSAAGAPFGSASQTDSGWGRLFNANLAPEGGWLLFAAFASCLVLVLLGSQSAGSKGLRILTAMGTTWFLAVYVVLSYMGSMTHTYYVYSLAAPLAFVIPAGLHVLWGSRVRVVPRLLGVVLLAGTGYANFRIFQYSDEWGYWPLVMIGILALASMGWSITGTRYVRPTAAAVTVLLVLAPLLTNSITLSKAQTGTNPVSGPASNNPLALSANVDAARQGQPPLARHLGFGVEPSQDVTRLLRDSSPAVWAAATYTAQNAAQYQLAARRPVIALGGWLGSAPAPTLKHFQALVKDRQVAYFISQAPILDEVPLGRDAVEITDWVRSNFEGDVVDGVTIYDLRN